MAKSIFRCSKCDRTFSMPAHLARHASAIHGAKRGRKSAGRKTSRVKARVGRPKGIRAKVGRPPKRSAVRARRTLGDESARLLSGMRDYHNELMTRRSSLETEIGAIASAIEAMGAVAPQKRAGRKPKRARSARAHVRAGSLKDYIGRVLRQHTKPMSPNDIARRVLKAGFKTKAKDFPKAISNTLPEMKIVKKVGFGMYRL